MPSPDQSVQEVHVQPGESCLVTGPAILRTVLGSCVGVAFLVPRLGIAALCHPMLPRCPANLLGKHAATRYVDFAIRDLARQFDSLGAARSEIQVKLFGGADVLDVAKGNSRPTVGKLNSEMALRTLEEEGFRVAASSLGGRSGVQIQFHTNTGDVILRRLDRGEARRRANVPGQSHHHPVKRRKG
jgi:chemotaxis protein CheD